MAISRQQPMRPAEIDLLDHMDSAEGNITQLQEGLEDTNQELGQETVNRQQADTALGTRIDDETQARTQADTALDTKILNINNIIPSNAFSDDNTVKDYIDNSIVNSVNEYQVKELIEITIGDNLGYIQGCCVHDGYMYYATYENTQSSTYIVKINLATGDEEARLSLNQYVHCNSIIFHNGYLYTTGNKKIIKIRLSDFTVYEAITLDYDINQFAIFEDGLHVYTRYGSNLPDCIYIANNGICSPIGLINKDTVSFLGYEDVCQIGNNIGMLISPISLASMAYNKPYIDIFRFNGTKAFKIILPIADGTEYEGISYHKTTNTFYLIANNGKIEYFVMPDWFNVMATNFSTTDRVYELTELVPFWTNYSLTNPEYDGNLIHANINNHTQKIIRYANTNFIDNLNYEPYYVIIGGQYIQASVLANGNVRAAFILQWSNTDTYIVRINYQTGTTHSLYLSALTCYKLGETAISVSFTEDENEQSCIDKINAAFGNVTAGPIQQQGSIGLYCAGKVFSTDRYNRAFSL